jgi:hypothetical protein
VVEHRAETMIRHVDALSRHVGAITNPDPLSIENVQREQSKDAFCRGQKAGNYSGRSEFLLDKGD